MLISLAEYAKDHGLTQGAVRNRAAAGGFATARKIGRNWVIDSEEPYVDRRIKSGLYVGWPRAKKASEE